MNSSSEREKPPGWEGGFVPVDIPGLEKYVARALENFRQAPEKPGYNRAVSQKDYGTIGFVTTTPNPRYVAARLFAARVAIRNAHRWLEYHRIEPLPDWPPETGSVAETERQLSGLLRFLRSLDTLQTRDSTLNPRRSRAMAGRGRRITATPASSGRGIVDDVLSSLQQCLTELECAQPSPDPVPDQRESRDECRYRYRILEDPAYAFFAELWSSGLADIVAVNAELEPLDSTACFPFRVPAVPRGLEDVNRWSTAEWLGLDDTTANVRLLLYFAIARFPDFIGADDCFFERLIASLPLCRLPGDTPAAQVRPLDRIHRSVCSGAQHLIEATRLLVERDISGVRRRVALANLIDELAQYFEHDGYSQSSEPALNPIEGGDDLHVATVETELAYGGSLPVEGERLWRRFLRLSRKKRPSESEAYYRVRDDVYAAGIEYMQWAQAELRLIQRSLYDDHPNSDSVVASNPIGAGLTSADPDCITLSVPEIARFVYGRDHWKAHQQAAEKAVRERIGDGRLPATKIKRGLYEVRKSDLQFLKDALPRK